MFKLEMFELLNEYKGALEYDKERIKNSIVNLIKQYPEDFEDFLNSGIDPNTRAFLENCYEEVSGEKINDEEVDDVSHIKNAFNNWLTVYNRNGQAVEENLQIVKRIVEKYFDKNYVVLERILGIEQGNEYEIFKNMILNEIRAKFATKIEEYMDSEKFTSLGFFAKRGKRKEILRLLDEIGNYKFDYKKIMEALN
ncbi:MAG: hypothetical protein ACOCXG_05355 [Nanoarchaeota archaeon]